MSPTQRTQQANATQIACQVSLMVDYKKNDAAKIAALPGPNHRQLVEAEQQTFFGGAPPATPLTTDYKALTQFPTAQVPSIEAGQGLPRAELLAGPTSQGDALANGQFPAPDAGAYLSCRELALARILDFVESLDSVRYARSKLGAFYFKGDAHRIIIARFEKSVGMPQVKSLRSEADLDSTLGTDSIKDFFADPEPTCVQMVWDPITKTWIRLYNFSFSLVEVSPVGLDQAKISKHVIGKRAFLENLVAIAGPVAPEVVPDFRIRLSFEIGGSQKN